MRTVVARLWTTGAENGMGGPGWGAPEAGLGIWCTAQVPLMRSPITAAGWPMLPPQFSLMTPPLTSTDGPPSMVRPAPAWSFIWPWALISTLDLAWMETLVAA